MEYLGLLPHILLPWSCPTLKPGHLDFHTVAGGHFGTGIFKWLMERFARKVTQKTTKLLDIIKCYPRNVGVLQGNKVEKRDIKNIFVSLIKGFHSEGLHITSSFSAQ